jgi:membrane protease YdiL (CAAX protease family)
VAVSSSLLGIVTGVCEELSFRGLGMPLTADRIGLDLSSTSGLAGALMISSLTFGLGHWSWGGAWRDNLLTSSLQTCTGLYLGALFVLSGGNVVVPAVSHSIYDAFTLLESHISTVAQANTHASIHAYKHAYTSIYTHAHTTHTHTHTHARSQTRS